MQSLLQPAWRFLQLEFDVSTKTCHVGVLPTGSGRKAHAMTSPSRHHAERHPWRVLALALPLAAAGLSGPAQASALVAPWHTLYSAYSYAHIWQGEAIPNFEGPFEKGNSCACGTLNSFGNASSGDNNAYANPAIDAWQATDYPGGVPRTLTAQARATGTYYGVGNSVGGMPVYGEQTDEQGHVAFQGQVYLQSDAPVILEASHVGSKPNWMYEFWALTDLVFAFDYSYVLGGTPMPPELWIDGVSSLDPNLSAGTLFAQLSGGMAHKIELRNTLALFQFGRPGYVEHAEMEFQANWTISEAAPNNTVPEPGTWALIVQSLGLMAWVTRRPATRA